MNKKRPNAHKTHARTHTYTHFQSYIKAVQTYLTLGSPADCVLSRMKKNIDAEETNKNRLIGLKNSLNPLDPKPNWGCWRHCMFM